MLARINLLQIHYRHRHARLPKKMPWLKNRLGLATFPKQITETVCSVLKPAFMHDTLHKLQEKTLVGSVVFDKQFWPTTDALDEMWRHDEWLNIQEHSFSIKKIGQYFRTCKPLSAQDTDGW